jgi:hypothetical protein
MPSCRLCFFRLVCPKAITAESENMHFFTSHITHSDVEVCVMCAFECVYVSAFECVTVCMYITVN